MPVRAVLLDKDGTIVDVEASWGRATLAVIEVLAQGDPARAARLVDLAMVDPANGRFDPASPIVAGSAADYGPPWAEALGRAAEPAFFAEIDALYRDLGRRHLTALPGAAAAVERAHRSGIPLGLATNDAEENARANLEDLGLARCFPFVAGYDSGHGAKPGPGMVIAFASHAGVAPNEVALVGDSLHDLIAARSAGALAVAVTTGLATEAELAPLADLMAPDLAAAMLALLAW